MGAVTAVTAMFSVLALWFVVRPWTVARLAR
jgi:hypothetical protein